MKPALIAVLLLAGCGIEPKTEETQSPAAVLLSTFWHVVITGQSWGCDGTLGFNSADGKAVEGSWSCNNDLRFPPPGHYYNGPLAGTLNGSALKLSLGTSWQTPIANSASLTYSTALLSGQFTGEQGSGALVATKL